MPPPPSADKDAQANATDEQLNYCAFTQRFLLLPPDVLKPKLASKVLAEMFALLQRALRVDCKCLNHGRSKIDSWSKEWCPSIATDDDQPEAEDIE